MDNDISFLGEEDNTLLISRTFVRLSDLKKYNLESQLFIQSWDCVKRSDVRTERS
jgi:hypothetical protein